MPEPDLLYRVALAWIPGIGPVYTKKLLAHFGNARAIFQSRRAELARIRGMGQFRVNAILGFDQFEKVEKEMAFMDKHGIRCLFFTDKDYPQRLLACKDAPILFFYLGNADLNVSRVVSIVGTRVPSQYGRQAIERFVREIAGSGPLVISGLAFGIDAAAHTAALAHSLPTVAVLGHGLDKCYPPENKPLAVKILRQGGLLTNFSTQSETSPHNFPLRNRIVAGMCDALVVVETDSDGGSMLTVKNALSYGKKIFAFPGRLSDKTSKGCNQLIQQGSAKLLLDASQMVTEMGWNSSAATSTPQTGAVAAETEDGLTENEKTALCLLRESQLALDEISQRMKTTPSVIAMVLFNLEMRGLIRALPGKMYRLAK